MKLIFEYDVEHKVIYFFGCGFQIYDKVETYEDIAKFAKSVIERDITIPGLEHRLPKDTAQQIKDRFD